MMTCDAAFRVIARRYLGDLTANHDATCKGDPAALHQMRVAVTRLRTVILFFSPMVADSRRTPIRNGLKWLNAHLGAVRDLDVAIGRLGSDFKRQKAALYRRSWSDKRADSLSLLARALQSARYRRLIKDASGWIENGRSMLGVPGLNCFDGATRSKNRHRRPLEPNELCALNSDGQYARFQLNGFPLFGS